MDLLIYLLAVIGAVSAAGWLYDFAVLMLDGRKQ